MAVTKETYNYGAKNEVRKRLKNFISEAYSSQSQRENLRVLTLMGHEPTEYHQVWGPLGIPPENVTSVEKDREAYDALSNNNPGINIEKNSIEDYVINTDQSFDIINFDYHGNYNIKKVSIIEQIAYLGLLDQKGIFSTWYSGRREKKNDQKMMKGTFGNLADIYKENIERKYGDFRDVPQEEIDYLKNSIEMFNNYRNDFVGEAVSSSFNQAQLMFEPHPLVKKLGISKSYENQILNSDLYRNTVDLFKEAEEKGTSLRNLFKNESNMKLLEEAFEIYRDYGEKKIKEGNIPEEDKEIFMEKFNIYNSHFIIWKLEDRIRAAIKNMKISKDLKNVERVMAPALFHKNIDTYFISNKELLKYHSDNGTPMYADFFKMDEMNPGNKFSFINKIKINKEGRVKVPGDIENTKHKLEITGFGIYLRNQSPIYWGDREYVSAENGNSGPDDEQLTVNPSKKTASNVGKDVSQDSHEPEKNENKPKKETNSLTKEDKEFVRSLLEEGYSKADILENFPDHFTDYQIRGIMASITREKR